MNPIFTYQNIDAVLFDCDGVLVDTEYLKFIAWKEALASQQVDFTIEEYMPLVGHSSKNILKMIQQNKGIRIDEAVIADRQARYLVLQEQGVPPLPEMISYAIRLSQEKRFKLGLASSASKKEILNNLHQTHLDTAFDCVVSGVDDLDAYVDAEGKNKPKPYIYLEAAKRLGVEPARCIVFEDTAAGIEAAFGAGMIPIAVPNRFTVQQDFSKAARVILSYEDLEEVLY